MPNMHNISILITFQKLPLRTYSLAELILKVQFPDSKINPNMK